MAGRPRPRGGPLTGAGRSGAPSVGEARLLQRLRRGEPGAADELWRAWGPAVAACCLAVAPDRDGGIALARALQAELGAHARAWPLGHAHCCLVAAWVLRRVSEALELPGLDGIVVAVPPAWAAAAPVGPELQRRLRALPAELRLVYVVDLLLGCPADQTAALTGLDEQALRHARAAAAWKLVERTA